MSRLFADHVSRAKQVLAGNWQGAATKPAPSLYPHQWNWDSGFIAMGYARFDLQRAMTELETLFAAQWHNGMVPQIVFNPDALGHYFPEPDFWQTERSPNAPEGHLTSGITMPPVHAIAVARIARAGGRSRTVAGFLERIYPKLMALHEYLYRERDPADEGLVYIRHPWESGVDNAPTWDGPLGRMELDRERLPDYQRRDLEHGVDASMRPSDADYDRYVYLVDLFRRAAYDEEEIRKECPFLVQDPLFNSLLCRADEALEELSQRIGADPTVPRRWRERTAAAIRDKLWHPQHRIFDAYDLVGDAVLEVDTAAGFLPLFAGAASQEQAAQLYERLDSASFCALHQGNCFTIPNFDTEHPGFARDNYWRGPVWININWMLAHGLQRYGYTLKADSLRKDLLQLPIRFGFYEYFDSFDGTGYGSRDFSWTAALFIDLVEEFYSRGDGGPGWLRRVQGALAGVTVLNREGKHRGGEVDDLGAALMRSVRTLRDRFYDTRRGRVDYEALRRSREFAEYRALSAGLRGFDPSGLRGRHAKIAFWVNLYNTIVVDAIASLGIQHSVREIPELFRKVCYEIDGRPYSPDDIEHGILRGNARPQFHPLPQFGPFDPRRDLAVTPVDPRIHFALVCGSRSCAPIEYYEAARVFDQLDVAARSFVNSSEVVILPEQGKVLLSEIFRWYAADFGGRTGILDFLYDYLASDEARAFVRQRGPDIQFEYIFYDWNLNR